jgi:S1-C subfamily serine protease
MWMVKRVVDEMIANHESAEPEQGFKAWHPWLGIKPFAGSRDVFGQTQQVDDGLKMFIDWPDEYWDIGVWIDTVWPDSPAAQGGIHDRDILYSVSIVRPNAKGDEQVIQDYVYLKTVEQLETMVTTAKDGDHFIFGVYRNGRTQNREVEIAQHPGAYSIAPRTQGQRISANSAEYF